MATNLITLQEYKAYSGINSTNQDATINSLVPKVSSLVKQICRRTFVDYVDDYRVETVRGGPTGKIVLKETPLLQVASVEFSDDFGKNYVTLDEYDHYVVDQDHDTVEFVVGPYTTYNKPNAFKVTYTAGYETIPADLKLAVLDLVSYYLRSDSAVHSTKSANPNTMQIEYVSSTNLPAHIKRVLDLYTADYT